MPRPLAVSTAWRIWSFLRLFSRTWIDIPLASLVGRDVDFLAVHLDVAVAHELARLGARRGESEGVDDVIEPQLELAKQIVAGDAGLARGLLEVEAELLLQQAVDALDLLLFAKLDAVAEDLGTAAAMLARRVIAALDRALILETAVPFEKQLHTLSPAEPANGIRVTSHYTS